MTIPHKLKHSQREETESTKTKKNALKSYTAITSLEQSQNFKSNVGTTTSSNAVASPTPSTFSLLSIPEAQSMIESLTFMSIPQIASSEFMTQYAYNVERLNQCAHWSAQLQTGDEFVVDGLVTHDKVKVLIHTLLAVHTWKIMVSSAEMELEDSRGGDGRGEEVEEQDSEENITKPFRHHLALHGNSLRVAFTLHVETTIITLLTLICYHADHITDLPQDYLISLVDYCARQMTLLASTPIIDNEMVYRQTHPKSPQDLAQYIQSRSTLMELEDNTLETDYKTAVASVGLARLLCQHLEYLPLSVQSRVLDTHDYAMLFIPLLEEPPWTRRRSKNKNYSKNGEESIVIWEKYIDNEWKEVSSSDLLQMTQLEGQAWLSIFTLMCTPCIRERYALTSHRKQQLLRLRKYLHPVIVDQIPVLGDVRAYMDQLSLMDVSQGTISGHSGNGLLLQQVDVVGQELRKGLEWASVAKKQWKDIFQSVTDATDLDLRLIANVYDGQEDMEEHTLSGGLSTTHHHARTIANVYEEVEPMAAPLKEIVLFFNKSNQSSVTLKLDDKISSIPAIQTPHGPFKRCQLEIQEEMDAELEFLDYHNMFIEGRISFEESKNSMPKILQVNCCLLEDFDSTSSRTSNSSEIRWVQLGKLEERVVLQLGFKQKLFNEATNEGENSFVLQQAFFSQPSLK